jgi:hypothetical protein
VIVFSKDKPVELSAAEFAAVQVAGGAPIEVVKESKPLAEVTTKPPKSKKP